MARAEMDHAPALAEDPRTSRSGCGEFGMAEGQELQPDIAFIQAGVRDALTRWLPEKHEVRSIRLTQRCVRAAQGGGRADLVSSNHLGFELSVTVVSRGIPVLVTRYASGVHSIDLDELAKELRVRLFSATQDARDECPPGYSILLPTAAAQLLQGLISVISSDPLEGADAWASSLVDFGADPRSYSGRYFDHEGTPTSPFVLLDSDGRQATMRTLRSRVGPGDQDDDGPLTGHAAWAGWQNFPQASPSSVAFSPSSHSVNFYHEAAESQQVLTDIRPLGVSQLSGGDAVSFRALRCRRRGNSYQALAPLVLVGHIRQFLKSIDAVSGVISFMPGDISVGASSVVLDATRLTA
ncbi:metallopeptidase TldD-related protein [Streptomyces parvus]|nr:metallopeptidase TldD-related protein [Streptomyces parvus]